MFVLILFFYSEYIHEKKKLMHQRQEELFRIVVLAKSRFTATFKALHTRSAEFDGVSIAYRPHQTAGSLLRTPEDRSPLEGQGLSLIHI